MDRQGRGVIEGVSDGVSVRANAGVAVCASRVGREVRAEDCVRRRAGEGLKLAPGLMFCEVVRARAGERRGGSVIVRVCECEAHNDKEEGGVAGGVVAVVIDAAVENERDVEDGNADDDDDNDNDDNEEDTENDGDEDGEAVHEDEGVGEG